MTEAARPEFVFVTARGQARVILTDGQNVTLRAAFASPPGSPLSGVLLGTDHAMGVKVHGCRKCNDTQRTHEESSPGEATPQGAQFEITGRWVNLSREARALLLG